MPKSKSKPKRRYTPRPVLLDTMSYVRTGMMPVPSAKLALSELHLKNHSALDALATGQATTNSMRRLAGTMAIGITLAQRFGHGAEYAPQLHAGAAAVKAIRARSRLVATGPELTAVKEALAVHDAQLDITTVAELEVATNHLLKAHP